MEKIKYLLIIMALAFAGMANAQDDGLDNFNMDRSMGAMAGFDGRKVTSDSIQSQHKEIPRGLTVWTIDPISGDRYEAVPDTVWYMNHNKIFVEGMQGEYNTLGNNGSARINRIFTDRFTGNDFIFTHPYDYFITQPGDVHFTNTYSPITNLEFNTCGDKTNGEDHLKARFAVNAGKRLGLGFKFDYIYAPGYYANQNTSHFGYNMWASYLGDQYQAHLAFSLNHQKVSENGGITNDEYITHPELFDDEFTEAEIPTQLSDTWNRLDNQHIFFNQRYSLGFKRKVKMTEKEIEAKKFAMAAANENVSATKNEKSLNKKQANIPSGRPDGAITIEEEYKPDAKALAKDSLSRIEKLKADSLLAIKKAKEEEDMFTKYEYVPVTSFFHTLTFDNYKRNFISRNIPSDYYSKNYITSEDNNVEDVTKHYHIRNYLGVALLEGFNKYAQFGIKAYVGHELKHFELPDENNMLVGVNENNMLLGAQLSRQQGDLLHFNINGEFVPVGNDIGQVSISGETDLNFRLFGDNVQLAAKASYTLASPSYFMGTYHSRNNWWDVDMDKENWVHIEGLFSLDRTNTKLRIAADNISNYTYLGINYSKSADNRQIGTTLMPKQAGNVNILTAQLMQNFNLGILHWDNTITYQNTTNKDVIAVPDLNVYSALYLRLKIAKVLDCDLGGDIRYFTSYYAPEYSPALSSFAVQQNSDMKTKIGNYPFINVFANFQLKQCRFFVMMSHVNCSSKGNYFMTPHHPSNTRIFRIGLNWNFFN